MNKRLQRGFGRDNRISCAGVGDESGIVYIIGAITLAGITLFIFACLQLVYGTARAIDLTNIVYQTSQTMQSSVPYSDSAFENGAWYLYLQGFEGVVAQAGSQALSSGRQIEMTYDSSVVPNRVHARARRETTLLAGLMSSFSSGISGLQALEEHIELGGTSDETFVSMHIDTSHSMNGKVAPLGETPEFADLLTAYGLDVTPDLSAAGKAANPCFPLDLAMCAAKGYPDVTTNPEAARACCSAMRRHLPFYLGGRAYPVASYDPGGLGFYPPIDESKFAFMPYNPGIDYTSPPPHPLGLKLQDSSSNLHLANVRPVVCGSPLYGLIEQDGLVETWKQNRWDFHLDHHRNQYLLNQPGVRIVDYKNFSNKLLWTHPDTAAQHNYGYFVGGDPIDWPDPSNPEHVMMRNWGTRITSQDVCTLPWDINLFHLDLDEFNECASRGFTVNPELASGGCWSQIGAIRHQRPDIFTVFLKITQIFTMAVAEIVPRINFSTFAGPTYGGNVTSPLTTGGRLGGNWLLYEGIDSASEKFLFPNVDSSAPNHIYEDEINMEKTLFKHFTASNGSVMGLPYIQVANQLRWNHILPYLHKEIVPDATGNELIDSTTAGTYYTPINPANPSQRKPYKDTDRNFRNLSPNPDPDLYPGAGGEWEVPFGSTRSYFGSMFLMPLENPKHPFRYIDTPGFNGVGGIYPGRCLSLQADGPTIGSSIPSIPHGYHPSHMNLLFPYYLSPGMESIWNTRDFFPRVLSPQMETISGGGFIYPDDSWRSHAFAFPRWYTDFSVHSEPGKWVDPGVKPHSMWTSQPYNWRINYIDPATGTQASPPAQYGAGLPVEGVKTLAPCIFAATNGVVGGTDVLSAFESAYTGVQQNVAQNGPDAGNIILIFTDGEPNMPGNQKVLNTAYGYDSFGDPLVIAECKYDPDCRDGDNNVVGGGDYDLLISDIKDKIEEIEALSENVLTIVLYTERDPTSPGVFGGKAKFKALFDPTNTTENTNPDGRVLMEILGVDKDEYQESYLKALSIIAVLIRTYTILID